MAVSGQSLQKLAQKRKAAASSEPPAKKSKATASTSGKGKAVGTGELEWPDYFIKLFKTFKALNTVITFCFARKKITTTFSSVRTSVENILKAPLELSKVAEIKALLPSTIRFAYIPADDHKTQVETIAAGRPEEPPDVYASWSKKAKGEDEHVLVLEFLDNDGAPKESKQKSYHSPFEAPMALTPAQVKDLIQARNQRFESAVNELLLACAEPATPDTDPVLLVQSAAKEHIPLDPKAPRPTESAIPSPHQRPAIVDVIEEIKEQNWYHDQIADSRVFDEKTARWGELSRLLSSSVLDALKTARSVTGFYAHQAAAINALWEGRHVIVSTSTASGKSIIYQVPVLCQLEQDRHATAMFIYPTKALAQDQKLALEQLLSRCEGLGDIRVYTYDGDTPKEDRRRIRDTASVIFTNFDMLHASILPNETLWRGFLKNMKLVVVDELHYYNGPLGSHVALIMRRLRRVCAAVGNRRSQFISCSATISNPEQHMRNIFGVEDIEVVTDDGAPTGRKDFLLWRPALIDPRDELAGRVEPLSEACQMFCFLMKRGIRCIVFCKIRRTCELAMKMVRQQLIGDGRTDILSKVKAYRGGYSQQDRRKIEAEAFSGNLLGIIATNALELGVDIGTLDAVITLGFPHNLASFRQQTGRAGRRARDALSVLVVDNRPIDQHYLKNPDEIHDKSTSDLLVDLENKVILDGHLQCAAHEMPINLEEDEQYFGSLLEELSEKLKCDQDGWYHTNPAFLPHPSSFVSIRGGTEDMYIIIDISNAHQPARVLEDIEFSRAIFETYEGGVFMHQGLTFVVAEVDHDERIVKVMRSDVKWITKPRDFTNIDPMKTHRIREIQGSTERAFYGRIHLFTRVFGFYKLLNKVIIETVDLQTPPYERDTTGMWIDIPKHAVEELRRKGHGLAECIHSAQHAVLSIAPLFSMASAGNLKTECKAPEKLNDPPELLRMRPARLIFYDACGKGGGVAAKAFDHISPLLRQALDSVEACSCEDGCLSCILSSSCSEKNIKGSKIGAILILKVLLGRPIDWDTQPAVGPPTGHDRITDAEEVGAVEGVVVETDVSTGL
ncbi:hypothetical protein BOTBODRAFT_28200 [Botryobasidium botryosum FD-172 SS1]|uniref:DEAD/DEAH box helicase n=1 Tax=Botryobasidium botryosum (strain FD-172 SS1) TaxID=930990 RepID=A0A067MV56_BOTB1|nr:hypothetical protein BOTBODRAFT_28200 [Botryobasidium botryosum FD-172 SS1]